MTPQTASGTQAGDLEAGLTHLATVGQLLTRPPLARVYIYACYYGPVTRPEIETALEMPKTTVYDHVDTLEGFGVVTLEGDRPEEVRADPIYIDDDETTITPTLLHAVALQEIDDDIAHFVDRYGVGKLGAAVSQAGLHYAGQITQRMAADPLGISTGEATLIITALKPVLAAGQQYDPYFDRIFLEIADEIAFETDIDVTAPAPRGDE